jgi:hypothetical protein
MIDPALRSDLLALVPDGPDAPSLVRAVRRRHVRRRTLLGSAGAAVLVTALAAGTFAVVRARSAEPAAASRGEPSTVSRRPPCGMADPFSGFSPGTDSASVARGRGMAPTRLVAHAAVADLTLENVRVDLLGRGKILRSANLGTMRAQGQDLRLDVGDTADDGSAIGPGSYDVFVKADVTGANNCGAVVTEHVEMRAGILAVR